MNPPSTPDTTYPSTQAQQHGMAHPAATMPLRAWSQRNGPPSGGRLGGPFGGTTSPPGSARVRHPDDYAQFPAPPYRGYGEMPLSPEAKRRRFNGPGVYVPSRGPDVHPVGPGTPHPYPYGERRTSLPRPEAMMPRPGMPNVSMGPPPRGYRAPTAPHSPGGRDPSLTLPPLQTQQGSLKARVGSPDMASIEAMVASVPSINKVKLLAKVAPPLGAPAPSSPAYEVRGAIIAIEGMDEAKVRTMTDYLGGFLGKDDGNFVVKRYEGVDLNSLKNAGRDNANLRYLEGIQELHARSRDMVSWITTKPKGGTEDVAMTTPTSADTAGETDGSSSVSPKTTPIATVADANKAASSIPIALVSRYQLSMVDTGAVVMPINDAYAPLDHWQWTAALMRGCVGPDITIVVRGEDGSDSAGGANAAAAATNVEIRLADAKCVIITQGGKNGDGFIDEKALRRVGFEVDEYLRK